MRPDGAGAPTRFHRHEYFPKDWQLVTAEFLALFHRYSWIYKPLSGGGWLSANEKWKLTDSEILKAAACAHPKFYIGSRAGKTTRYAVLDIDAQSKYHNVKDLHHIKNILQHAGGLDNSVLYRSSYSGGWHLYIFFEEPVSSRELYENLSTLLKLNHVEIRKGTLEVFPHPGQQSQGMGLRLPLQPGWAWLDPHSLEVIHDRNDLEATQALELFIDDLNGEAITYKAYKEFKSYVQDLTARHDQAVTRARQAPQPATVVPFRKPKPAGDPDQDRSVTAIFGVLPPGIDTEVWLRGQDYYRHGLTAPSQRADAIFCLSHYLFYGDPSCSIDALGYGYEQDREWLITEILSTKHHDQSKDINRGRSDALAQVHRAAHWLPPHKRAEEPRKYSPQQPIAWIRANANKEKDARKRISGALEELKKEQRSFTTTELQKAASCGRDTLYKHDDIWRKDYEDLAEGFFAICPDEYNAVVGAASPESKPPTTSLEPDMPSGRLAARRIAYELSMRAERQKRRKEKQEAAQRQEAETSWRKSITERLPEDITTADVHVLKVLIAFLAWRLGQCPSHEDQLWLTEILSSVRKEFQCRQDGPEPDNKHPP